MDEERLAAIEAALTVGGPFGSDPTFAKATVWELCAEVRRWRALDLCPACRAEVCSPEAIADAQAFLESRGLLPDGSTVELREDLAAGRVSAEQVERLPPPMEAWTEGQRRSWAQAVQSAMRPRTGGVRPSPGNEAAKARSELAAIREVLDEQAGAHNSLVGRVVRLEMEESVARQQTEALLVCGRRLNALEAGLAQHTRRCCEFPYATSRKSEQPDALNARVVAFLEGLGHEPGISSDLHDERRALLEALTARGGEQ